MKQPVEKYLSARAFPFRLSARWSRPPDRAHAPETERAAGYPPCSISAATAVQAAALFKTCLQRVHFVGEDRIIFRERVPDNNPVEDAESAGEQEGRSQRKKQDELGGNGARFRAL